MKRKFFTILILLCLVVSLGAFALPFAFADGLLIEDGYYPFDTPYYLHAGETVTIVGKDAVYVVDSNKKVSVYKKSADKAIYENGKLVSLVKSDLYIDDTLLASNVLDFDVNGDVIAYTDSQSVHIYYNTSEPKELTVNQTGFSAVAVDGNKLYLKKDSGAYDEVYLCDNATTIKLYRTHLKKFDSLIFDSKLWGIEGNVLYDIDANEKKTVSPYANAVSVHNNKEYYLADGCLYINDEFILGSGNNFYYPTAVNSNATGIYAVDENGISTYSFKDGKFSKTYSFPEKASAVAVTAIPQINVYYTIDTDVYLNDNENAYDSVDDSIVDIAVDGDGNVYYTTSGNTYKNKDNLYDIGGMIAIAPSKKDIYTFDGTLYKNGVATTLAKENVISFDVDGNGNIYFLTESGIECFDNTYTFTKTISHSAKQAVSISISYETNTLGQIAVVDKAGHNILFVEADVYIPKFSAKDNVAENELIRSVTASTPIFKDVNRSEITDYLSSGSVVLCSAYSLDCDDFLAYVSYKNGNKLVNGYVDKDALSDVLNGEQPRYETAKTIYDNVMLHSLPYGLQEADNNLVVLITDTDSELKLISKYNVFGEDWYKAEYNGSVGYVSSTQIQLGAYVPSIMPDTNAKLVKATAVYDKINGKFVEDTVFLAVGTEVQVIGVFDSNTEYTQIKYYDGEAGGTRTCYVKTDALKYDYVTFEQQFALIAVILISASMIVVIIIFVNHKKKHS